MTEREALPESHRIGIAEAKKLFDEGKAVFVDVRSHADYEQAHVASAESMPLRELAQRYTELPRDRLLVFY